MVEKVSITFKGGSVAVQKSPSLDLTSATMLLSLAAVWGGSFFFVEVALQEVPPLTITLHRVFWAVPALALIVRWQGLAVPRSIGVWGAYFVMGALNNAIPFSLIIWAQVHIDSGLAAILNATTAVFGAVIAGVLLSDERLSAQKLAGAVLGLAGVAFIMGRSALTGFDPRNLAQLAMLGAAVSYAFASVWGKSVLSVQPPLMNAFGMVTASSFLMVPIAVVFEGPPSVSLSLHVWAALMGSSVNCACLYALLCHFGTGRRCKLNACHLAHPPICNCSWRAIFRRANAARSMDRFCYYCSWVCGDRWPAIQAAIKKIER